MSPAADLHAAVRRYVDDVVLPSVAAWDRADELPDEVLQALIRLMALARPHLDAAASGA